MSQIEDLSNQSAQSNSKLRELLARPEYPSDPKTRWVIASLDIAIEHQEAILLLIKSELFGSALAMLRIVFDTLLRALWINGVATDEQIKQAWDDELKWQHISVGDEVEQNYFPDLGNQTEKRVKVLQGLKKMWPAMCSLTHSGGLQIASRFTNGELKPNYLESTIRNVMIVTNQWLMLVSALFFLSMGHNREAKEALKLII